MSDVNPFRVVHRARRRRTLGLTLTGAVAASALAAFTWLVPAAVADPTIRTTPAAVTIASPVDAAPGVAPAAVGSAGAVPPAAPVAQPATGPIAEAATVENTTQAAVLAAPSPLTGVAPIEAPSESTPAPATPRDYAIAVDTNGYQAELDECLWVRMDLAGASAPIVGAHNNCGGEVVLDLIPGDIVTLSGQSLDGRYLVTDSRNGRPGQDAAEATGGFAASVILQTCYFDGPDVRLVALVRVT
jgi:hypothetical protein